MALIEPGRKAPAFTLKDQAGKIHRLSDYAGNPVVLFFYPKDDTSGCTKEACGFRDHLSQFRKSKAAVLGISILDERMPHSLNFTSNKAQSSNAKTFPSAWWKRKGDQ